MIAVYYIFLILTTGYLTALLILYRGFSRLGKQEKTGQIHDISVIVCAHNEEDNLPACLEALSNQTYLDEKIEFIIVNDRSDDNTQDIIDRYVEKDTRFRSLHISELPKGIAPKKNAINKAIGISSHEIMLFTDADGRPGKNWAGIMSGYFNEYTGMVLGYAPYSDNPERPIINGLLGLEYLSHAAIASSSAGLGNPVTCVGTNMAYRKSIYRQIGGFGEYRTFVSGDDDLMLTRFREETNTNIAYAVDSESHVFNAAPDSLKKFIHQRMRYTSKGLHYPLRITLALITLFVYYLMALAAPFSWIISVKYGLMFCSLLAFKISAEYIFMRKAAFTLNDKRNIKYFILAELLHLPYVVYFAVAGQFKTFRWGGLKNSNKV